MDRTNLFGNRKRRPWIIIYSIYLILILVSASAFYAEQSIHSRSKNTFDYNLTFRKDGVQGHYNVKLTDPLIEGKIWVTYNSEYNHLEVKTKNIRELNVDCQSIAKEKTKEILDIEYKGNEEEYKQYFIEKEIFTTSVDVDHEIKLSFEHAPYPSSVIVNNNKLIEGSDYNYDNGIIISKVPIGKSEVTILFRDTSNDIRADFITNNLDNFHIPNTNIIFNASVSLGEIVDYIWDFSGGSYGDGKIVTHKYSNAGDFYVTLVVRDKGGLTSRITKIIYVSDTDNDKLPDKWESKYDIADPNGDYDNDGLNNLEEYQYNTEPFDSDTDDDGFSDSDEIKFGTDPLDDESKPIKKKKDAESESLLFLIASIAIVIVVSMVAYMFYISKKSKSRSEMEPEHKTLTELELSKPKNKIQIRKQKKSGKGTGIMYDQSQPYFGSQLPTEILLGKQIEQPAYYPTIQPKLPPVQPIQPKPQYPSPSPSPSPSPPRGQQPGSDLHNQMIDHDFKLPTQYKIKYECATCKTLVGPHDKYCTKCGDEFED